MLRLRRIVITTALAGGLVSLATTVVASDYLTEGGDNVRTGWLQNEKVITKANVRQIKLLWKTKLPSKPREMHNLFSPLVATSLNTPSGVKEVAIVAGISDNLWGVGREDGRGPVVKTKIPPKVPQGSMAFTGPHWTL